MSKLRTTPWNSPAYSRRSSGFAGTAPVRTGHDLVRQHVWSTAATTGATSGSAMERKGPNATKPETGVADRLNQECQIRLLTPDCVVSEIQPNIASTTVTPGNCVIVWRAPDARPLVDPALASLRGIESRRARVRPSTRSTSLKGNGEACPVNDERDLGQNSG